MRIARMAGQKRPKSSTKNVPDKRQPITKALRRLTTEEELFAFPGADRAPGRGSGVDQPPALPGARVFLIGPDPATGVQSAP